jgi:ABC-type transport system involved in cytochrome bd biosynthesis fused ATPase/permease subunit
MGKLAALVKPLTGFMILAVCLGVLGNVSAILIPVSGSLALLKIAGFDAPLTVSAIFGVALACALLRGVFRYGEQTCNHYIAFKLLAIIRDKMFSAMRRLCPAKLDCKERGDLIALLTGDIELLEVFYAHTISPVAIAVLASLGAALFVGAYHPLFGAIAALGYVIVGAVIPAAVSRLGRRGGETLREASGALSGYYLDSLRGLSDLIQYGRGGERRSEIARRTETMEAIQGRLRAYEGLSGALSGLTVTVFSLGTLAAGFALYQSGAISFDGVLIPAVTVFSSFGSVLALASLSGNLLHTLAAGRRVLALLEETPEVPDIQDGRTPDFSGAESRGLSFSYGGEAVLRDLSIHIPKGKITGVMGRSGSGKSTFLKLLMRFWNAPEGSLFISGTPVNEIRTAHLRSLEGLVAQDTDLFHDSIEANIRLGKPEASREEVIAAAKRASAHEFIQSLPKGYETEVGELGSALSGGERQRIGLSRAFLHDAPLLLLDEPTSNLDSLNEGVILKALREEAGSRTVVLVSHRKSAAAAADRTYNLENGRIKEKARRP